MAGGTGSRLWPLSTTKRPKPFLPLMSRRSMLQDTLLRLENGGYEPVSIICNKAHRDLAAKQASAVDLPLDKIILEAQRRGTAFTITIAALSALKQDPDALILVLPCDHYIGDAAKLHEAVKAAAPLAASGKLVVFGVKPEGPSSAYGYVECGEHNQVLSFKEKPDRNTAQDYIRDGRYLWNAGIFLFPARRILDDIQIFAPDVYEAAEESWTSAVHEASFVSLPQEMHKDYRSISVDYAVLEQAKNIAVIPLETQWDDLGTWASVLRYARLPLISANR